MAKYQLKVCPFCDGPAGLDKVPRGSRMYFSPSCRNNEVDCVAYKLDATFATREEAAEAWNMRGRRTFKKSPDPEVRVKNPVRCFNCSNWTNLATARLIKHENGLSVVCGQFMCKIKAEECDATYGKPLHSTMDWAKVTIEDTIAEPTGGGHPYGAEG